MSARPSLPDLLAAMHERLATELGIARKTFKHPVSKGDVAESSWLEMLRHHLPQRYQVNKAFVIDSRGESSEQIDIVVHDRQYSPFVLHFRDELFVPAESVYAAFEVKQDMDAGQIDYAGKKIASLRRLHRTSLPIKHAGGKFEPKKPERILGGLLCLESNWNPPFGEPLEDAIKRLPGDGRLDIGCAVQHGIFEVAYNDFEPPVLTAKLTGCSLALFVLRLIARLQDMATVPCLDVMAYARCLQDESTSNPQSL